MGLSMTMVGSLLITLVAVLLGASSTTLLMLLPVHLVWGMLCGVVF